MYVVWNVWLTLTMASENEMLAKKSTPSFLVEAARLRLASSRAALSVAKTDWMSKTPGLEGVVGMLVASSIGIFSGLTVSQGKDEVLWWMRSHVCLSQR